MAYPCKLNTKQRITATATTVRRPTSQTVPQSSASRARLAQPIKTQQDETPITAEQFRDITADQKTANLLLTPQQQEGRCAIEPTIFTQVPNKWGAQGWTVITLANADELTARAALLDAWNNSHKNKK